MQIFETAIGILPIYLFLFSRRKLLARLQRDDKSDFSSLSNLQVSIMKIVNFQGVPMNVFLFEKEPLLFEIDQNNALFPTGTAFFIKIFIKNYDLVYLTWKFPKLFPIVFVNDQVMTFLENGADLMLPGVYPSISGISFPDFEKDDVVGISTISKTQDSWTIKGPLAIGRALLSSRSMLESGMKGRGFTITHLINDQLW